MSDKKIILEDSADAAVFETREVEGWWSTDPQTGRILFWENDERMARWHGCTHKKCECGNIYRKNSYCEQCQARRELEKYSKYEVVEWDEDTPLFVHEYEHYVFDADDLFCFCSENELNPADLTLLLCDPVYPHMVFPDYWEECLPEDGELPDEIQTALDAFNEVIKNSKPTCWYPGKKRVVLPENWIEELK